MSTNPDTENSGPPAPNALLQNLITENQGLRTVLGTLLQRASDVLIVRRQDRVRYFQNVQQDLVPSIVVEGVQGVQKEQGVKVPYDTGDLRVTLKWSHKSSQSKPSSQPVAPDPVGPSVEEVVEAVSTLNVTVSPETVESWSAKQRIDVLNWAAAETLKGQGLDIQVPERPAFLPEPSLIVHP